jgi:hypothetical protein
LIPEDSQPGSRGDRILENESDATLSFIDYPEKRWTHLAYE